MRVSMQCGRCGNAKHNDRSYRENGENDENEIIVQTWNRGENIENAEIAYYKRAFEKSLNEQNEKHRARRQYARIKKIEDIYKCERYKPEEMILQIGDMSEHPKKEIFELCLYEFTQKMSKWNAQHGRPFKLLSVALHFDEHTPHVHLRRVWQYSKNGNLWIGQEKALAAAGVDLPDPGKKPGRYNNRKMTFDAMQRKIWQKVVSDVLRKKYGIGIETEPRKYKRPHLSPKEYRDQAARLGSSGKKSKNRIR